MNAYRYQVIGGGVLLVAVVGCALWFITPKPIGRVSYVCDGNKTVDAVFYEGVSREGDADGAPPTPGGRATITLSPGQRFTLTQTLSADGARYANADESIVFWDKGDSAIILEDDKESSYTNCRVRPAGSNASSDLPQVYGSVTLGFSIHLPPGFVSDETYRYTELGPGKEIPGVKFTIPETLSTSTNLAADSYISVEKLSGRQTCSPRLFLEGAHETTLTDNGVVYRVASSTGAGAGNRYEEWVYTLPAATSCIAVRYFIHYGVIENYPPGAVRSFDEASLLHLFDTVRRSVEVYPDRPAVTPYPI